MKSTTPIFFLAAIATITSFDATAQEITVSDAAVLLKSEVRLPASEPGIIREVYVHEGDRVAKGDLIVSLDDEKIQLEAQAAAQEAEVARLVSDNDIDARFAEKSTAVAQAELQRALDANKQFAKSVSKSEVDQLQLQLERSALAAEQAARDLEAARLRADLEMARARISMVRAQNMQITAPFDGVVVQLVKEPGEWANIGEPIARVIQLNQLRVEGLVDGRKYGTQIKKGQAATFTVVLPNGQSASFKGTVTFISPEIHPVNGLSRVWAEVENPEFILRPGLRGELKISS